MSRPEEKRHSIRVNLAGGLGNQMFMYAAGRALAERTGGRLLLNTTAFSRDYTYKRIFLLDRFRIAATVLPNTRSNRILDVIDKVLIACPALAPALKVIREPTRSHAPGLSAELSRMTERRSVSLRGYWQDERYFRDYADIIRRELNPPPVRDTSAAGHLLQITRSPHPVAIGMRFYRELASQPSDPKDIIAAFRRIVADHATQVPGCDYFVFTDEPRYFDDPSVLGVPITLITHGARNEDALEHLHLMSRCRTFYIGYSSYHWWGAWLGNPTGKRVTYLHFPGRRGADYAAAGWDIIEVD